MFLDPFEKNKLIKAEVILRKLNCPAPSFPTLTGEVQNTFKRLCLELNFKMIWRRAGG